MAAPLPERPPRRKRELPRELPGEIKVVMGLLILYGLLALAATIAGMRGGLRAILIPAGFFALNAALFVGLLLRTRWGWWATTVTFGLFALFFLQAILRSLLSSADGSLESFAALQRIGVLGGVVFLGLYAVPFWLLVKTRRRYLASRKVSGA